MPVESDNYGDCRPLKDGVFELRFTFGTGYSAYFGEDGDKIVVLLCGVDESSQVQDIAKAKACWKEYFASCLYTGRFDRRVYR